MATKRNKIKGKARRGSNPYKVDVAGSTPAAPTTLRVPKHIQVIEIPTGSAFSFRVTWDSFEAKTIRVIRQTTPKAFDFGLKSRRSGNRSARSA